MLFDLLESVNKFLAAITVNTIFMLSLEWIVVAVLKIWDGSKKLELLNIFKLHGDHTEPSPISQAEPVIISINREARWGFWSAQFHMF